MPIETQETPVSLKARIPNPAVLMPDVMQGLLAVHKAVEKTGLSPKLIALVTLRASQINGCSVCVDMHWRDARKAGDTDERIFAVAAWRDAPYFTASERAALDLTEALTRIADRPDPVPDEIWNEAAAHFDQKQLLGLITTIAMINVWNRFNIATKQVAGEWLKSQAAAQR
jgi:AhpD family alkylhydroperoxidase